jgi:hypothetical protein
MKKTRLNLAGHMVGLSDSEIPNRITNCNREGETRVSWHKTILMDVNDDKRKVGVRHWKKEDEDRNG